MEVSAYRRFCLALLGTSVVIATVGMTMYLRDPSMSVQPTLVHRTASVLTKSSVAPDPARDRRINEILDQFVAGFASEDTEMMRSVFPDMTRREARVMRSIRRRLGEGAAVRIGTRSLAAVTAETVDLDFVIFAQKPGEEQIRRLPFHATVRLHESGWQIDELR